MASKRVTAIACGSKKDADLVISVEKTEVMLVKEQGRVSKSTPSEAKKVCKHVCPHLGCNRVFFNLHDAKCHAGREVQLEEGVPRGQHTCCPWGDGLGKQTIQDSLERLWG